jgi:hypothetical protein
MMVTLVSVETAYVTYMVYVVQKCSMYGCSTEQMYGHGNVPFDRSLRKPHVNIDIGYD